MVMQAERSQDLQLANWGPGPASGRMSGSVQRQEKGVRRSGRKNTFSLTLPFCSTETLHGVDEAYPIKDGNPLCPAY